MRRLEVAAGMTGVAAAGLLAASGLNAALAWPGVVLVVVGVGVAVADTWLETRNTRVAEDVATGLKMQLSAIDDRVIEISVKVEALQKQNAIRMLG